MALDSISITKYIPYKSIVHSFDARLKILALILMITLAFLPTGLTGLLILIVFAMIVIPLAKLPLRTLLSPIKMVFFLLVVLTIINLLTATGGMDGAGEKLEIDDRLKAWDWDWTVWSNGTNGLYETLYPSVIQPVLLIVFRIYLLMLFTIMFTSTTTPTDITNGLESLMRPLKVVRFPVEEIALIISIALRFIPTILEETGMIMNSQASRGVDFSNGKLKDKAKSISTLVIPMFANSFQRADDLANAIEARGYVIGEPRTRYRPFKLTWMDFIISLFLMGMLTIIVLMMVTDPSTKVYDETTGDLISSDTFIPWFLDDAMKFPY